MMVSMVLSFPPSPFWPAPGGSFGKGTNKGYAGARFRKTGAAKNTAHPEKEKPYIWRGHGIPFALRAACRPRPDPAFTLNPAVMKKFLLAVIVGAIVLFAYQGLSWTVLPIHKSSLKYSAAQDTLLEAISGALPAEGVYYLPMPDPDAAGSQEDYQAMEKERAGKPWAILQYHPAYKGGMGLRMGMGLLIDLMAVSLVVYFLGLAGGRLKTFGGRFIAVWLFGVFFVLTGPLSDWNWWNTPRHYMNGIILDGLLGWGLCGLWLAWFLGRGSQDKTAAAR